MSEDISVSNPASPSRAGSQGWVKFDETEGGKTVREPETTSPARKPTTSVGSSGVSSARGSVKSSSGSQQHEVESAGAQISVSEVQVIDEAALRHTHSNANGLATANHASVTPTPNGRLGTKLAGQATSPLSMDNVNLSDGEISSPTTTDQSRTNVRGKRFSNGEVIVTLLPVNERFPWVVPARFRPELVPEELMAPVLTLTVEEYVQTMEKLTTDMRFSIYNIFYKRILALWITLAFTILLILLFSGFQGIQLFAGGVAWLILNAAAIFLCMWIKLKLNKQMEKCMSFVNSGLLKHNIVLGVDDRGKLSCQKVNLCFIYFESADCVKKLESILEEKPEDNPQSGEVFDREAYLRNVEHFEDVEVVVPGRSSVKINRKGERAEKLFLHYIQRWAKDYLRRRLDWMVDDLYGRADYAANTNPRHIRSALCPCQYIEEHLRNKRQRESLDPCKVSSNPCHWCH